MSKKRLDKCPGPLRRVRLFTDSCSSGLLRAPLTCAETIMSSRGDNSLNVQKSTTSGARGEIVLNRDKGPFHPGKGRSLTI